MEAAERKVSLAGLSLIGAGAVLGLALVLPATPASADSRPVKTDNTSSTVDKDR